MKKLLPILIIVLIGAIYYWQSRHANDAVATPIAQTANTQHPSPNTQTPSPNTQHPSPNTQTPSPNTHQPSLNTHQPTPNTLLYQTVKSGESEQLLVREGYTCSYNAERRVPNYVAWRLTASRLKGPAQRKGVTFEADYDSRKPHVQPSDYTKSGYGRGHMCPAADNKYSKVAMRECFLMTNMCPQRHELNAGDWNDLEMECRTWARRHGELIVVSGPVFTSKHPKTIGRNRVQVPDAFFKVVLRNTDRPKAIAFLYPNADDRHAMNHYVRTVDQIEELTGHDFFAALDDGVEATIEAHSNLREW